MELDSSQRRTVVRQVATWKNPDKCQDYNLYFKHCEGGWILEQVSEEKLWISVPGVVQESTGHSPEKPDLIRPVLKRKLDWRNLEVPFNLNYDSDQVFNLYQFKLFWRALICRLNIHLNCISDTFCRKVFPMPVCNYHYKHFCPMWASNTSSLCWFHLKKVPVHILFHACGGTVLPHSWDTCTRHDPLPGSHNNTLESQVRIVKVLLRLL